MKSTLLSDAVDQYLANLASRGRVTNTVNSYQYPLRWFLTVNGNIPVHLLNDSHLERFFNSKTLKPKTRNLYLDHVKGFLAYCRRKGWTPKDWDPAEDWDRVKEPREEMPRIPVTDFPRVLDAATDPRDRAVVALGMYTFARAGELATLRIRDLDFDKNTILLVRHKTKETDLVPMVSELGVEMVRWLNFYRAQQGGLDANWYLVPSKGPLPMGWTNGKLGPTGAPSPLLPTRPMSHPYAASGRALRAFGVEGDRLGQHVLRRSGARALFDRLRHEGYDGSLKRVQSMLGHKKASTTEHYLGLDVEAVQRNELLAGKPMFPDLMDTGTVISLEAM